MPILRPVSGEYFDVAASPQVTIRSIQDPAVQVRLHDRQFIDQDEIAFVVDLHADGLNARLRGVVVAVWDPQDLSDFMDGLATDFRGWKGERSWVGSHLKLTALFHSGGHVELCWTLQPWVSGQDSWEASVTTWVEGGQQLTNLAADIRVFLARP